MATIVSRVLDEIIPAHQTYFDVVPLIKVTPHNSHVLKALESRVVELEGDRELEPEEIVVGRVSCEIRYLNEFLLSWYQSNVVRLRFVSDRVVQVCFVVSICFQHFLHVQLILRELSRIVRPCKLSPNPELALLEVVVKAHRTLRHRVRRRYQVNARGDHLSFNHLLDGLDCEDQEAEGHYNGSND